jgi:4'-phosphopantetheinyl transferase
VLQLDSQAPLAASSQDGLLALLSAAEQERHQAYRFAADRSRFLRARAGLRRLLGAWHQCAASQVPLDTGAHGKPFHPHGPAFNVSHSGGVILIALHPHWPVGVDVEQLRPGLAWEAIAERVLGEPERQAIQQLPAAAQAEAFLAHWCELEAELKAAGSGFAGLKERLRATPPPSGNGIRRWRLALPAGYQGAVALIPPAADGMGSSAAPGWPL